MLGINGLTLNTDMRSGTWLGKQIYVRRFSMEVKSP